MLTYHFFRFKKTKNVLLKLSLIKVLPSVNLCESSVILLRVCESKHTFLNISLYEKHYPYYKEYFYLSNSVTVFAEMTLKLIEMYLLI